MLLIIDTATAACSVALIDGQKILAEEYEVIGRGHAERLIPMIDKVLGGRTPRALLVDCGPGSFTGLRVGLATAHGLAIGWQVPIAGYSSLAVLAASAAMLEVAVALTGGHGELFVQSYGGEPLAALDELRSLPPREAAAALAPEHVVGSGAEALGAERGFGTAIDRLPRAADARLLPPVLRDLPPRPIYGRAPDAKPMQ